MSALSIRRRLRHEHCRMTTIAVALALAALIALHHSGPAVGAHHDADLSSLVQMCLAVGAAVGAAVAAIGVAILALRRWRCVYSVVPAAALAARPVPPAQARHGPQLLLLLCVSQR